MRLAQAAGGEEVQVVAVRVVAVRVAEAQEVVARVVVVRMEVVLAEAVVAPGLREWVLEASQPEGLKVQAMASVQVQATA